MSLSTTQMWGNYVHPDWKPKNLHSLCCGSSVTEDHEPLRDPDGWPRERYFRCSACGEWCATGANSASWRERQALNLEQPDPKPDPSRVDPETGDRYAS